MESRNKVFYQEFDKTFSVISSKTVKWALFMWIMGQNARPWTTKALADYAACSIITIERAIAALKAAGLIATRSKTKATLYRFSKLVPSFTTITVKYAAYKSATQLRLHTELGIDANTNSSSVTNPRSVTLTATNSKANKNWSAFNLQANARAEFRYRSRFDSKYKSQYDYSCSSNYGYKHNSCSNAKCYISTSPKIITGLPVKDTIERLKVLGIDRAGSVKILRNYPDSDSCTNFNEIERAIAIKLATDGSRIIDHGAFSYKAFMDCYGLGLDLVAEVEHYQRYKRVDYQKAVYKLTKQSNSNNQSFTKLGKKIIGKANGKEVANTTEKHCQDIELLCKPSPIMQAPWVEPLDRIEILDRQLIGAMHCQVPPMPELVTSVNSIGTSPATQVLWDDLHLAVYSIAFLQGLDSDLTRWEAEEADNCIDLWTSVSNYRYLNKLISSTADASEVWRHYYFYKVLSRFKELIARELVYQNKYLEDSATRLGIHLEKHEVVISVPNKSPYDISTLSPFFISYPQQKTTPLSNLQLLLKDKKHHYEHSKNKSYRAEKHSSLREHAKSPQVE